MDTDISRDLLTQYLLFFYVKDYEFFICAKFWFNFIILAEVIARETP